MPIFYYSATFDESVTILGDLCERSFRVIPDRTYDQSAATQYDRVTDELIELLREGPGFYLAGAFTNHPVPFARLRGGPAAGKYMIELSVEGPLLSGMLARINPVDGVDTLLL